jgi:uncharacterized protein involved in exopolysaccharide biosynthesis
MAGSFNSSERGVTVMARYLETLLRNRLRFVILLLIAPLSLGASSVLLLRGYEGTASLWISDPGYLGQGVAPINWNQRLSPAQNTTDTLRQLLSTHAFDEQVSDKLVAADAVSDPNSASQLAQSLASQLRISADGTHLVRLSFSNPSQGVALAVLDTTIALYVAHEAQAQQAQLDVSVTFLSAQVTTAESAAAVAQQALSSYLEAHPAVRPASGTGDTGIADLDRLVHQVRQSQDNLSQLRGQLAQSRLLGAAAQRLVETNTQIVDQPRIASSGLTGDGRSLSAAVAVAFLCALAAGVYLLGLVWADQSARDARELERRLRVPVLTTIPLASLQERF